MCSKEIKESNFQTLEDSDDYEFYYMWYFGNHIWRDSPKVGEVWWFYHLVDSMVRDRVHKKGFWIASGDKKKSYEGRWWIETPSHELKRG